MDPAKTAASPNSLVLLVAFGVAIMLLAMVMRRRTDSPSDGLNVPARLFLVLLRIAIGWHCLVEGLDKLSSANWSSEGYLRESVGPLAPKFRAMAGDRVFDQLTMGDDKKIPAALSDEWQRYYDAFAAHHKLDDEQTKKAGLIFDQNKSAIVTWMGQKQSIQKISPNPPPVYLELDIPARLKIYAEFQKNLDDVEKAMPGRGQASWTEWKEAKANLAKWRGDLKKDLDQQTAAFKKTLTEVLTSEQKSKPLAEPLPPRPFDWNRQLDVADYGVKYGLIAVGIGLILGLFTRLAALAGAVLLFMFYLAMPALPYLPESPKAEGHYLYINKNIIEMLALLALACLPTGLWAGADGLLQFLNPFNWRGSKASDTVVEKRLQGTAK